MNFSIHNYCTNLPTDLFGVSNWFNKSGSQGKGSTIVYKMFLDKKTLLKIWKLIIIYEVNKEDTVIIVSLLILARDKIKDLEFDRIRTN